MIRKIRSLVSAIHYSFWLGLLTLLLITTVLPVTAQHLPSDFRLPILLEDFKLDFLKIETRRSAEASESPNFVSKISSLHHLANNPKSSSAAGRSAIPNPLAQSKIQNLKSKIHRRASGFPQGNLKSSADALTPLEKGISLYEAGRFSEAVTVWQQATQDYQAQRDYLNQAISWNYLSLAYQDLNQWQEAEKAITQSLNLLKTYFTNPKSSGVATPSTSQNLKLIFAQVLNTQGSLQLTMGQAEAALNTWKQSADAYTQAGDQAGMLGSQINQAQALQTLGLYRRAQTTLEEVNQQLQTQSDLRLKATGLQSLGAALQVVGNLEESQKVLEQSLAMTQQLDTASDSSEVLFSLGNTARALQNFEKAVALYQQAAATTTNPTTQVEAQLNQLSLRIQLQQWQEANALFPQIQSQLSQLSPSRAAVYAEVNFAESLMKMGRWGDEKASQNSQPITQLLAQAIQQARMLKDPRAESYALGQLGQLYIQKQQWSEARNLTQQALQIAQAMDASDIAYRWQWQLGQIFKQQGQLSEATTAYTEAVNTLQSLRSDLVAINPDVQFTFRESVEPIYRELVSLLLHPPLSQENLKQVRQVIESLQLAELDNFFREACLNARKEQIDQVDPTAAVIYPIILPDRLAVILSLPGQPLNYYETLQPQSEIKSILDKTLQSLNPATSNKLRLRLSQQVYDWLIRPAETQLAQSGVKTLVFVLDDALRNLPMAILHDGEQYLVEKYSIALSQGLQLLEPQALVRGRIKALAGGLTEARQGFSALPAVESELKQIASVVPSEILLNQKFIKTTLEKEINTAPFKVVHLATHGQFSSKAEDTFLLTWDGRINVKDLDRLVREREDQNPIELLVLSACQTAAGDKRASLGLAGVAVRSGARSTLATLWSVRDESTADLMTEFYHQLTQPEVSKAEALRQAQLILLKNPNYEHPFYWAAFILVGNWL